MKIRGSLSWTCYNIFFKSIVWNENGSPLCHIDWCKKTPIRNFLQKIFLEKSSRQSLIVFYARARNYFTACINERGKCWLKMFKTLHFIWLWFHQFRWCNVILINNLFWCVTCLVQSVSNHRTVYKKIRKTRKNRNFD